MRARLQPFARHQSGKPSASCLAARDDVGRGFLAPLPGGPSRLVCGHAGASARRTSAASGTHTLGARSLRLCNACNNAEMDGAADDTASGHTCVGTYGRRC
eukprot:TRINITY_DN1832_c0_g1_i7.p3 TRINITY_DN1832_c0_g1~~TRINITY_DN1832_c0_g1_i7.p3  ORF type:complete len:101 (-),score=5.30 TRINITY_DN1832_c0_g1_i7:5-307(-)